MPLEAYLHRTRAGWAVLAVMVTSFRLPGADLLPRHFHPATRMSANFFTFLFPQPASACSSGHKLVRLLASRVHLYVASSPPEKFDDNKSNRIRICWRIHRVASPLSIVAGCSPALLHAGLG